MTLRDWFWLGDLLLFMGISLLWLRQYRYASRRADEWKKLAIETEFQSNWNLKVANAAIKVANDLYATWDLEKVDWDFPRGPRV